MIDYRCLLSSCTLLDKLSSFRILKLVLKALVRLLFLCATNPFASIKYDADILLVSSTNRKDLLEDLNVWCTLTRKSIHRVDIRATERIDIYFPSLRDWCLAKDMMNQAKQKLEFDLNAFGRLFIFLRALEACKYFKQLSRKSLRATPVVFSHMEMQFYENIVVQVAKLGACETYAMQHGFYSDDGLQISSSNVNAVNYLASVADNFLAWGSQTTHQVGSYLDCNSIIVGKPASIVKEPTESAPGKQNGVLLLLDSWLNKDLNQTLIDMVIQESRPGEIVYVIHHPDDNTHYKGNFRVVSHNEVSHYKVIGLNSSVLIQYGVAGYWTICHSGSRLLKAMNLPVAGSTPPNKLMLVDDIPQAYWRNFIQHTGSEAVGKLDGQVA